MKEFKKTPIRNHDFRLQILREIGNKNSLHIQERRTVSDKLGLVEKIESYLQQIFRPQIFPKDHIIIYPKNLQIEINDSDTLYQLAKKTNSQISHEITHLVQFVIDIPDEDKIHVTPWKVKLDKREYDSFVKIYGSEYPLRRRNTPYARLLPKRLV